jgi:hypothetical protein
MLSAVEACLHFFERELAILDTDVPLWEKAIGIASGPQKVNTRANKPFFRLGTLVTLIGLGFSFGEPGQAQERTPHQLESLNVAYVSITGSRIPLWIAKDAGLFEKYGLSVNLIVIASGNVAIGALVAGDVDILGAPGTTSLVSAARGLPVAIIGTFGPSAWKLAAHPSITSVQDLKGKTVGISRMGTTGGLQPATGIGEIGPYAWQGRQHLSNRPQRIEQESGDHASGKNRCNFGEPGQYLRGGIEGLETFDSGGFA